MPRRTAPLLAAALAAAVFLVVIAATAGFLADVGLPRTVDGPARTTPVLAVVADLGLLALFAVQHSVMARRSVKRALAHHVPPALERTVFVLASEACLLLVLVLWEPVGGRVWTVGGPAATALWVLCAAGWGLAVASLVAVDVLEVLGLRQAGWGVPRSDGDLTERGLYAVVRHPLMTGLLVACWATPRLGVSHLLFATAMTAYVLVGIRFEERDLRRTFGPAYDAYAARVPALVPGLAGVRLR